MMKMGCLSPRVHHHDNFNNNTTTYHSDTESDLYINISPDAEYISNYSINGELNHSDINGRTGLGRQLNNPNLSDHYGDAKYAEPNRDVIYNGGGLRQVNDSFSDQDPAKYAELNTDIDNLISARGLGQINHNFIQDQDPAYFANGEFNWSNTDYLLSAQFLGGINGAAADFPPEYQDPYFYGLDGAGVADQGVRRSSHDQPLGSIVEETEPDETSCSSAGRSPRRTTRVAAGLVKSAGGMFPDPVNFASHAVGGGLFPEPVNFISHGVEAGRLSGSSTQICSSCRSSSSSNEQSRASSSSFCGRSSCSRTSTSTALSEVAIAADAVLHQSSAVPDLLGQSVKCRQMFSTRRFEEAVQHPGGAYTGGFLGAAGTARTGMKINLQQKNGCNLSFGVDSIDANYNNRGSNHRRSNRSDSSSSSWFSLQSSSLSSSSSSSSSWMISNRQATHAADQQPWQRRISNSSDVDVHTPASSTLSSFPAYVPAPANQQEPTPGCMTAAPPFLFKFVGCCRKPWSLLSKPLSVFNSCSKPGFNNNNNSSNTKHSLPAAAASSLSVNNWPLSAPHIETEHTTAAANNRPQINLRKIKVGHSKSGWSSAVSTPKFAAAASPARANSAGNISLPAFPGISEPHKDIQGAISFCKQTINL